MGTARTRRGVQCQAHHWVIDAPNGRESSGTCKHCGETRVFPNSTESVMWERGNTIRTDLHTIARPTALRLSDDSEYDE